MQAHFYKISGFYPFLKDLDFYGLVKVWYLDEQMAFLSEMQLGKCLVSACGDHGGQLRSNCFRHGTRVQQGPMGVRWEFGGEVFLLLKKETQERDSFCCSSGCRHFWMSHRAQPSHSQSWIQPKPRTAERRMKNHRGLHDFIKLPSDPSLGSACVWTSGYGK